MLGALAWSALEGVSITQLNPTYFELRRQVAELESALAADRLRAEIPRKSSPSSGDGSRRLRIS